MVFCICAITYGILGYTFFYYKTKDILNPFGIILFIWLTCSGISSLELSNLSSEWTLESYLVILIFAITINSIGIMNSNKKIKLYYNSIKKITLTKRYIFYSSIIFLISMLCAFIELKANGFISLYTDDNFLDKKKFTGISGIHYGTELFKYFSLIGIFELCFAKNLKLSRRCFDFLIIILPIIFTLLVSLSRGELLVIILGSLFILSRKFKFNFTVLISTLICVLILFSFLMEFRLNSSSSVFTSTSIMNTKFNSTYMYIAMNFENLNKLIVEGSQYTIIIYTVIKPIFEVLSIPIDIIDFNTSFYNSRTLIYGFYHDIGILGVIVYTCIIFSLVSFVYNKSYSNSSYILLLASLQKAIFTPFFGNYFTGGICICFPFIIIYFLIRTLKNSKHFTQKITGYKNCVLSS